MSSSDARHKETPARHPALLRRRVRAAARCFALAALSLPATLPAQDHRERAVDAALADGVTTAVGVAASGGLINPVGPLLATAMKAVTLQRASTLPETEQPAAYAAASAMWMGGTVSNVCITAVLLSGGGLAPACFAVGAAWGLKAWQDSEHERRYWERCAILRQFAVRQKVPCAYVPPSQQPATKAAAALPAKKAAAAGPASSRRTRAKQEPPPPPPAAPQLTVSYEVEAP